MAYETGTAANAVEFYEKFISFLKTNQSLVDAGENWTEVWNSTENNDIVLAGPGLTNNKQILIGIRFHDDPILEEYNIRLAGCTGIIEGANNYISHVNSQSSDVYMMLDSNPMKYWFVANGQRFIAVAKISTTYQTMYAGLFLPYADPETYNYPMFVGGSAGGWGAGEYIRNWRNINTWHSHFTRPRSGIDDVYDYYPSALYLNPAGTWIWCTTNDKSDSRTFGKVGPVANNSFWGNSRYFFDVPELLGKMRDAYSNRVDTKGVFPLWRCYLTENSGTSSSGIVKYGDLDGVFFCQKYSNAAENIITVDGTNHLVIQNVFRTDSLDYWALVLE